MIRIVLGVLLAGLLMVYEGASAVVGLWLNATRYREGPVVVQVSSGHSLHLMDLGIIGVALLPWGLVIMAGALGYTAAQGGGRR